MTNCRRGDVVLVLFPDSNLRTSKRRPALVVQSNLATALGQTIVAMITSNMSRAGHRSRVTVLASTEYAKASGLLMDSIVMTDNLATIVVGEVDRVIGSFPNMAEVDVALRATLSI